MAEVCLSESSHLSRFKWSIRAIHSAGEEVGTTGRPRSAPETETKLSESLRTARKSEERNVGGAPEASRRLGLHSALLFLLLLPPKHRRRSARLKTTGPVLAGA